MGEKMVLLGDLHFGIKANVPQFVDYQVRELDRAIGYAVDQGIKTVVFLGDIMNDRRNVYVPILRLVKRKFKEYAALGLRIIVIVGNHDAFYRNTNEINTPVEVFDGVDLTVVGTSPLTENIGGKSCLFMPWMATDLYEKWIDFIEDSPADYCFGHFEINGFVMNNSNKCRSSLKKSHFKGFRGYFSGHFHTKNGPYVGSLSQLDWNDYGIDKGFHVLDLDTGVVDFVRSDEEMFVKVLIGPKFDFESVAGLRDRYLKVYVNRKLTTKESVMLGDLLANSLHYEVIDNTVLTDVEVGKALETESFEDIVEGCINIQDIGDADKERVAALINMYYAEMLQEGL